MTTPEDPDAEILRRAQDLQAARLRLIEPLAPILAEQTALRRQLDEVDARYSDAYNAAVKGGWTPEELKTIGVQEPEQKPRGRTPARRQTRKRAAAAETAAPPAQRSASDTEPATAAAGPT